MHISLEKTRNIVRVAAMTTAAVVSVGLPSAFGAISTSGGIANTGANSVNLNNRTFVDSMVRDIMNQASMGNSFAANVTTGNNLIGQNTSVTGGAISAPISIGGGFSNQANTQGLTLPTIPTSLLNVMSTGGISTTGANSVNHNDTDVVSSAVLDVENDATIANAFNANLNSGGNSAVQNTTVVGAIGGGAITVNVAAVNAANTGAAASAANMQSNPVTVTDNSGINTTGFASDNRNTTTVTSVQVAEIDNDADISNGFAVTANSGNNSLLQNTTAGGISSAPVSVTFTASNSAN